MDQLTLKRIDGKSIIIDIDRKHKKINYNGKVSAYKKFNEMDNALQYLVLENVKKGFELY